MNLNLQSLKNKLTWDWTAEMENLNSFFLAQIGSQKIHLRSTCYRQQSQLQFEAYPLPTTSNNFQQLLTTSNNFQQLPTTSNNFQQLLTTFNNFQQLPTTSNNF